MHPAGGCSARGATTCGSNSGGPDGTSWADAELGAKGAVEVRDITEAGVERHVRDPARLDGQAHGRSAQPCLVQTRRRTRSGPSNPPATSAIRLKNRARASASMPNGPCRGGHGSPAGHHGKAYACRTGASCVRESGF
jgi:hypothetical protein